MLSICLLCQTLYTGCGVDQKQTTFIFSDTQIADEAFTEIMNNLLSSGEITNLYKPDEFEDVSNSNHFILNQRPAPSFSQIQFPNYPVDFPKTLLHTFALTITTTTKNIQFGVVFRKIYLVIRLYVDCPLQALYNILNNIKNIILDTYPIS